MDDYIDTLLFALRQRECTPLTAEYRCRERQESQALSELEESFSPEQKDLFLFYEAARNATSDAYVDWVARKAFLLAKEVYR